MYSMALLDMNTYIYAPKDDLKHRIHWRDMYSVDEAGIASSLHHTCCYFVIYFCLMMAVINFTWLFVHSIICCDVENWKELCACKRNIMEFITALLDAFRWRKIGVFYAV